MSDTESYLESWATIQRSAGLNDVADRTLRIVDEIKALRTAATLARPDFGTSDGSPASNEFFRLWNEGATMRASLKGAIEVAATQARDAGCTTMPNEPTQAMISAAIESWREENQGRPNWIAGYKAMLAVVRGAS